MFSVKLMLICFIALTTVHTQEEANKSCNQLGTYYSTTQQDHVDSNMKCQCKSNVEGIWCERCKSGYYDITSDDGCRSCSNHCDSNGTKSVFQPNLFQNDLQCNAITGECNCLNQFFGPTCEKTTDCSNCAPNCYNNHEICVPCNACFDAINDQFKMLINLIKGIGDLQANIDNLNEIPTPDKSLNSKLKKLKSDIAKLNLNRIKKEFEDCENVFQNDLLPLVQANQSPEFGSDDLKTIKESIHKIAQEIKSTHKYWKEIAPLINKYGRINETLAENLYLKIKENLKRLKNEFSPTFSETEHLMDETNEICKKAKDLLNKHIGDGLDEVSDFKNVDEKMRLYMKGANLLNKTHDLKAPLQNIRIQENSVNNMISNNKKFVQTLINITKDFDFDDTGDNAHKYSISEVESLNLDERERQITLNDRLKEQLNDDLQYYEDELKKFEKQINNSELDATKYEEYFRELSKKAEAYFSKEQEYMKLITFIETEILNQLVNKTKTAEEVEMILDLLELQDHLETESEHLNTNVERLNLELHDDDARRLCPIQQDDKSNGTEKTASTMASTSP